MEKSKILSGVCAISVLSLGLAGVAFADTSINSEISNETRLEIHSMRREVSNIDFSTFELLTDEQESELTTLQSELNGYIEKEKEAKTKMKELMKEYGINNLADKPENSRNFKKADIDVSNIEGLTEEQKNTLTELQNQLNAIREERQSLIEKRTDGKEKIELTDEEKALRSQVREEEKKIEEEIKNLLEEYGVKTKAMQGLRGIKENRGKLVKNETQEN